MSRALPHAMRACSRRGTDRSASCGPQVHVVDSDAPLPRANVFALRFPLIEGGREVTLGSLLLLAADTVASRSDAALQCLSVSHVCWQPSDDHLRTDNAVPRQGRVARGGHARPLRDSMPDRSRHRARLGREPRGRDR